MIHTTVTQHNFTFLAHEVPVARAILRRCRENHPVSFGLAGRWGDIEAARRETPLRIALSYPEARTLSRFIESDGIGNDLARRMREVLPV